MREKKRQSKADKERAFREKTGLPDPDIRLFQLRKKLLKGYMASEIGAARKQKEC